MKRRVKYTIMGLIGLFLLYNSVYFEKLDVVRAREEASAFDPGAYAEQAWSKLSDQASDMALPVEQLLTALENSPEQACTDYGYILGISNNCNYLLSGSGIVESIDEENVVLIIEKGNNRVSIATQFIYGSTVRDASRQVPVSDFSNTMDFNNVAAEMNQLVFEQVLPPFLSRVQAGDKVQFIGAASVRKEKPFDFNLVIKPISLKIL